MIQRPTPSNSPLSEFRINRASWQAYELLAIVRALPQGLLFIDLTTGRQSMNNPGTLRYAPGGVLTSIGGTVPASNLTNLQLTSGDWSMMAWWYQYGAPQNDEFHTILGNNVYVDESNNQGCAIAVSALNNSNSQRLAGWSFRNDGAANYALGSGTAGSVAASGFYWAIHQSQNGSRQLMMNGVRTGNPTATNANPVSSNGNLTAGTSFSNSQSGLIEGRIYRRTWSYPGTAGDPSSDAYYVLGNTDREDLFTPVINRVWSLPGRYGNRSDFFSQMTGF